MISREMTYNGQWITWGNARYRATSGMPRFQSITSTCIKGHGPIPEGRYFFELRINKLVAENIEKNVGGCRLKPAFGVQQIPRGEVAGHCEIYFANWGENRIRIEAADTQTRNACNPARGGFYIHDSHKGYTHGCIEVQKEFFNDLIHHAKEPDYLGKRFTVNVKYLHGVTNGGTYVP